MGQGQGVPLETATYSPVDARVGGVEDWSITVNPQDDTENQQLIQARQPVVEEGAEGQTPRNNQHRFKRVVFRSRMDEANGEGVVTSQPGPVLVTNLRLADKLKGFSCEEYQSTLQGTLNRLYGSTKILTVDEARCLAVLLQQRSADTLLKTVTTTSNLAAFTINQDLLRVEGAIDILVNLLHDDSLSDSVQVMLVQCIGNMAVNQTNNNLLQCCVPRVIHHLLSADSSELQRVMCVQALTNLSVDAGVNRADVYAPILPVLYQRLWSPNGVNIATLRLLVNLSCTADMIPRMLAAESRVDPCRLLNDEREEVLVRATTFLFYVASTVDTLGVDEDEIRAEAANYPESVYSKLFGGAGLDRFRGCIEALRGHDNEEVRQRTARIAAHLAAIAANLGGRQ